MSNTSEKVQMFLQAGDQTEELLQFITSELDNTVLDDVDIYRKSSPTRTADEFITVGVTLALGSAAIYAVARLLEKWLEKQDKKCARKVIIEVWDTNPALIAALLELEKIYANVTISQGMPDATMIQQMGSSSLTPQ
jgi:hypothetical protein